MRHCLLLIHRKKCAVLPATHPGLLQTMHQNASFQLFERMFLIQTSSVQRNTK